MTTSTQDRDFACATVNLEQAIDWIQNNLEPDAVFTEEQLESWAESKGYEKP